MASTLKRLDLLLREVQDQAAQENFWRLRNLIQDLTSAGIPGPAGPTGPIGPAGPTPTAVPALVKTFNTDATTLAGHLLKINGNNSVTKITDNLSTTIPNGVFGIGLSKPSLLQIDVTFIGIVPLYSGLTIGVPYFIHTDGTPTTTPPASGMVQQIGFAVSTTELFIQLMQPMRRN